MWADKPLGHDEPYKPGRVTPLPQDKHYQHLLDLYLASQVESPFSDWLSAQHFVPDSSVPENEVWLVESLTPLQRRAGFKQRILGKIINIGKSST